MPYNPYKRKRTLAITNQIRDARAKRARRLNMVRMKRYAGPYRTGGFYGASVRSPAERKVLDTPQTSTAVNIAGSVTPINLVGQGTDFTQRIGRRYNITAIQLRGLLNPDPTNNTGTPNLLRVMIVVDNQINGGATPLITSILNAADSTSFMNLNERERYKVIYDRSFAFGPINITAGAPVSPCPGAESINVYKKVNIPVFNEGTMALLSSISSGAVYVCTIGQAAAGVADGTFLWSARIRFVDA